MADSSFTGTLETLEIARGHDGFLRGAPEPVLLFGVYVTDGVTVRLLGRSIHRFHPKSTEFPADVTTATTALPACRVSSAGKFAFVVLAIGLEEDGGIDVQRMYGALEHHDNLSVWAAQRADVDPTPLSKLPRAWNAPLAVELSIDGAAASASCHSDKWIGAVCWSMAPRPSAPRSQYRLHFLAPDRRNDWTALVHIAH
jgi:hypothetical protein